MAREGYFDVSYNIPSPALTVGVNVISTSPGVYGGLRLVTATGACTAIAYDNVSTASGNLVDIVSASGTGGSGQSDPSVSMYCKNGLVVSISETGATGVVFFAPKG